MVVALALSIAFVCGCGGGGGLGSMMLKIVSPSSGDTLLGNPTITATMLNPAMATKVNFIVNGHVFDTVTPALTMTSELHTLGKDLQNGPVTIKVQSTGNVYTATQTVNVNNPTSIYVADTSGTAGSSLTVHVKLNNFAGAGGYHIFLNYDKAKLALDTSSVKRGLGVPVASDFVPNPSTLGELEATVTGDTAFTNKELLTASFQIKGSLTPGTKTDIDVPSPVLTSTTGSDITVAGVAGSVTAE